MPPVIPGPDPIGLPAPAWLLASLSLLTFTLHLLAMNLLAGGVVVMAIAFRRRADPFFAKLADRISRALPVTMSLTITLGVAPLLFIQVMYGQAFYVSAVLMAWPWLTIIGLLVLAYYGLYIAQMRPEWLGERATLVSWVSAVFILIVGLLHVTNNTLMLHPEEWATLYKGSAGGFHMNWGDHTVVPRYLHFMVAAMAIGGLGVILLGYLYRKADPEWSERARGYGSRWFLIASGIEVLVGVWFLASLPRPVMQALSGGNMVDSVVLFAGIALAVLAMAVVKRMPVPATVLAALTVALMAITRFRVRDMILCPTVDVYNLPVNPQWPMFAIFAVLLVAGLGVVAWMVWQYARGSSDAGGAAQES